MATATLSSSPSFPQFTITSEEISRYAELTSLLSQLEAQQKTLRAELLELYEDGAEQEETGPYLLAFTDQSAEPSTGNRKRSPWPLQFTELRVSRRGNSSWSRPRPFRQLPQSG